MGGRHSTPGVAHKASSTERGVSGTNSFKQHSNDILSGIASLAASATLTISITVGVMVTLAILLLEFLPGRGPPPSSLLVPFAALARCAGGLLQLRFNEVIAGFGWHMAHCSTLRTATMLITAVVHLRIVQAMLPLSLVATVWSVGWAELSYAVAVSEILAQLSFEYIQSATIASRS